MKNILKVIGIIILIVFGLAILVVIAALFTNANRSNTGVTIDKKYTDILTPSPDISDNVSYETLQKWEINNGGFGKTILIPESYLADEELMTRLGLQLKYDTRDDKN